MTERPWSAPPGEDHAFEALIRPHWDALYRLAYRMAGNAEDAEDLAQETVLRIFKNLPTYRGDSEFGTWAYRIGLNVCLTARRRRKESPADLEGVTVADSSPGPEAVALSHELRARLRREIDRLRPGYREAVVLRYYAELSYEEIARVLDMTENAARLRVSRGMGRLRQRLKRWIAEEER